MQELRLSGMVLHDLKSRSTYSEDRSPYRIKPAFVAVPKNEHDVVAVVNHARAHGFSITGRGAGSNLSGNAIGKGIVVDFSHMKRIGSFHHSHARVEPGVVFDTLNEKARKHGLFLGYNPSSHAFCTIGGNVNTKAAGLHSVKYGSADANVVSVRFVDARGRIIDTSKELPKDLEEKVMQLRKKLMNDRNALSILKGKEHLKTSSGYNLFALYRYADARDIVTHLMVGSVGTLGLITEIEMKFSPLPKKRLTCLAYFSDLKHAGEAVMKIRKAKPSAIEIMDSFSLDVLRKHAKYKIPIDARAALVVELDDHIESSRHKLDSVMRGYATEYRIEDDELMQAILWKVRSDLLTILEEEKEVISFVEDVGVPPEHVAEFIKDLQRIFVRHKIPCVIFGHAGEGNLHLRPMISRKDWRKMVKKIADECYRAAFRYNGTVTGEHGIGRNKAPYLKREWGPRIYSYFRHVKKIFDPKDILNPGVMFSSSPITKDMKY